MSIDASSPFVGLYGITPELEDTGDLLGRVRAALQGGMRCLQYRVKTLPDPVRRLQIRELAGLCESYGVPLLINDGPARLEDVNASGWHVGEQDARPQEWSGLAQRGWLGVSCYADNERALAAQRAGVHYVALGSFFPSVTKPQAPAISLDALRRIRAQVTVSIIAIGGITPPRARLLHSAGADAVAVLSDLFCARDIQAQAESYSSIFH